ncbi:hypothetical protein OEA41_006727 [Lepraria neglecta]|uniref:Uncharacterized protein n=1 Tax=Lepraria neglecta TaxID=209136 RepID=A0AAE0DNB9_9LECA|nr:hypothetical protein OEA41_006727 [Lepraria neglecta]
MSSSTTNSCIVKGTGCSSPTNIPEFIDTGACLCGLLNSATTLPDNGESIEYWRCIGNASADVTNGGNGKWYNTSLPSQEMSGISQPQNWAENPPDTSQAFVLVETNGKAVYQDLPSGGSPELVGADSGCTGKNDTTLSGMFYSQGKEAPKSGSTSSSTSTAASSKATSASGTMTSTTESTASATSTGLTSITSAAAPKGTSSAAANHVSLKSIALVGMILAPLASIIL